LIKLIETESIKDRQASFYEMKMFFHKNVIFIATSGSYGRRKQPDLDLERLNYQHLYYFWAVAKMGSIKNACSMLGLAQPTISGQLAAFEKSIGHKVFRREGRKLVLTEKGLLAFSYADEIFRIGDELRNWLKGENAERRLKLRIGVCNALDTLVIGRLFAPLLSMPQSPKLVCFDSNAERSLSELRLLTYDLALLNARPASVRHGFSSQLLAALDISIFGAPNLVAAYQDGFPRSLHRAPVILPTSNTILRQSQDRWFHSHGLKPQVRAEIEDNSLLKSIAATGEGLIFAPSVIRREMRERYGLDFVAEIEGVQERVFAVANQRNPAVAAIIRSMSSW